MKPYAGLTVLGVTVALSSSLYLAQSPRPFDLVGIKFCPQTANINTPYQLESQQRLDRQYCQYEHKMLKGGGISERVICRHLTLKGFVMESF